MEKYEVRFKYGDLQKLHNTLFTEENEKFSIILAKKETFYTTTIFKVIEILHPLEKNIISSSPAHISIKKDFIYKAISKFENRLDIDTLIEIHTHPFINEGTVVTFSGIDNKDELQFFDYLKQNYSSINYGSLVFSKKSYEGRIYNENGTEKLEVKDWNFDNIVLSEEYLDIYERNVQFMGLNNLRKIYSTNKIVLVGVGGLGSIVAEQLVHMGFLNLVLVDHDIVEYSNLNRLAGARYKDAQKKVYKVDAVKRHLLEINPFVTVDVIKSQAKSQETLESIVDSSRVFLTTDNHSSRAFINDFCLKYFIPFISIGVNITVQKNKVLDISGEIIKIFPGSSFCLRCLNRVNQVNIDYENSENKEIREKILKRGYIKEQKEPAVKTLNTILASLSIDSYINEFTNFNREISILVYENNRLPVIYEDNISIKNRKKGCFTCNL